MTLFPGDLTYASLDLRPGDTVTRVNGKPISRPEQASAVWKDLRTASDLVVDYLAVLRLELALSRTSAPRSRIE